MDETSKADFNRNSVFKSPVPNGVKHPNDIPLNSVRLPKIDSKPPNSHEFSKARKPKVGNTGIKKSNARVADKVLLGFKNDLIEDKKYIYTGNPIRASLSKWLKLKGEGGVDDYARVLAEENESFRDFYSTLTEKFVDRKPVILITGGSLGALEINNMIWNNLDTLLERYNIYHQMGKTYKKIDRVAMLESRALEMR